MTVTALSGNIYHISKISYATGFYAEPVLPEKYVLAWQMDPYARYQAPGN